MTHFDATVHPLPGLIAPGVVRLECVGNSSYLGKPVAVNGANVEPWFYRITGEINWSNLHATLNAMPPGTHVCPNLESKFYPTTKYAPGIVYSVDAAIAFFAEFARIAHGLGLVVCSMFEALNESAYPAIDSDRYAKAGVLNHAMHGLDKLTSVNNDAVQPIFDLSDKIVARCYAADALSPAQVRTITRRNIGEAYRVGRGKPIIAITRPDTLSDGDMAAQIAEVESQRVSIAYWLDMYADQTAALRMLNMSTATATREE